MPLVTALGVMSGTSMDAIDVALLRTDGENRIEPGPNSAYPYDPGLRRALQEGGSHGDCRGCQEESS